MERTVQVDWEIEQSTLGTWFRPSFEPCLFPYIPSHVKTPKERRQVFLGKIFKISFSFKVSVRLRANQQFDVPKNYKLVAAPLFEIYDNRFSSSVRGRRLNSLSEMVTDRLYRHCPLNCRDSISSFCETSRLCLLDKT